MSKQTGRTALGWTQRDVEDFKELLVKANSLNLSLMLRSIGDEMTFRHLKDKGAIR